MEGIMSSRYRHISQPSIVISWPPSVDGRHLCVRIIFCSLFVPSCLPLFAVSIVLLSPGILKDSEVDTGGRLPCLMQDAEAVTLVVGGVSRQVESRAFKGLSTAQVPSCTIIMSYVCNKWYCCILLLLVGVLLNVRPLRL